MLISRINIIHCLFLALLCFICYANSTHNPFIWDDESLIVNNQTLHDWRNISFFFTPNAWPTDFSNFYRPLQLVSYCIDYQVWRLNPFGYHLTNILIHTFNCILLYVLLVLLLHHGWASFIGSMIFTVHPLHVEAVTYISGRADLLAAFFILFFFITYTITAKHFEINERESFVRLSFRVIVLIISFLCALGSKESAIIIPLMLIVWHLFLFDIKAKTVLLISFISCGFISLVYGIWRMQGTVFNMFDIYSFSFIERFSVAVKSFALYCALIVAPIGLHMERMIMPPEKYFEISFLFSLLWVLVFIIALVWIIRKSRIASLGLLWFVVMLLPVLNIVPLNATFAEHWMYLPFIGLSIGTGVLILKIKPLIHKNILIWVIVFLVIIFSARTIIRNRDWHDPIHFYEETLRYNPTNIKILYNLGTAHLKAQNAESAINRYRNIISVVAFKPLITKGGGSRLLLRRLLTKVYNNMGNAFVLKEDYEMALNYYGKSLELSPNHELSHLNLAMLYYRTGRIKEAREQFLEVLKLNPHNEKAQLYLERLKN